MGPSRRARRRSVEGDATGRTFTVLEGGARNLS